MNFDKSKKLLERELKVSPLAGQTYELSIRKATDADIDILFAWANDEVTRKNSFNTQQITYEEHVNWFNKMMLDDSRIQYIAVAKSEADTIDVGQVRIDIENKEAEISYSVAPECRGYGFGKIIVSLICNEIKDRYPDVKVVKGLVKPSNVASAKVFIDNGFKEKFKQYEIEIDQIGEIENRTNVQSGGVIYLTNNINSLSLYNWISQRHHAILISDPLYESDILRLNADYVVSYNYSHIVSPKVISMLKGRIINMHISYLPYNRGANPNFWSFMENTPSGVTIHEMVEGLDTGNILLQKKMEFDTHAETFTSSYNKLHAAIQKLLKDNFDDLLNGRIEAKEQVGKGTYHKSKEFKSICEKIEFSYDDIIADVKARVIRDGSI